MTATAVEVTAVYVVGNTDGDGVYIRRTPDVADGIKAWPDGTVMEIIGPDVPAQERLWKQVVDPDGTVGFIPVEYLLTLQEAVATGAAELPEATPPVAQTVFVLPRVLSRLTIYQPIVGHLGSIGLMPMSIARMPAKRC